MSFCSYSKEYSAQSYTDLDNAFIYEFMPEATGDAVKVYVYGLFLCKNLNLEITLDTFCENLKLEKETVIDAFTYWEECGLLTILSQEPFEVNYLPISRLSKPRKIKPEKYAAFSGSVQALIPSRMISVGEFTEYYNLLETYSIKPEAMLMIIKYCVDLKGDSIGYRYISTVVKDFASRKILTVEQVEQELSSYVLRTSELSKILKAMSLKKKPEIEDLNYLNKWTKELGFETPNIIYAASKIKKGGMKKLDEFIGELYANKKFSKEEISHYAKDKENLYELTIKINRALSVYYDVIDTVVENYTAKWASFGYDEQSLLFIANYCFKKGKNTLQEMDNVISSLQKKGVISYESIAEHFVLISNTDKFIANILSVLGLSRKVTSWDRENVKLWKTWNFSDEMILEAASCSSGKANPIPYMNAILSTWKQKGIFTKEQIEKSNTNAKNCCGFANERTYTKEELEKVIDDIEDIEF